jgi:hypothetical protein
MSTQVNFHIQLITSDSKAASIVEKFSADYAEELRRAVENLLEDDERTSDKFSISIRGPEVVSLF